MPQLLLLLLLVPACGGLFGGKDDDDDDDDDGENWDEASDTGWNTTGGGSGGSGGEGNGSGGAGGDGTDGSDGADAIDVSEAAPDFGSTAGGQRVTLTGGPFDTSALVYFGTQPAPVLAVNSSTIEVEAPATSGAGAVDIAIETSSGAGVLEEGFTYWTDATGQFTTAGVLLFTEQVGDYWSSAPGPGTGSATVYFSDATPARWFIAYSGSLDSCANPLTYSPPESWGVSDPGATRLSLTPASGSSIELTWNSTQYAYQNDALTATDYRANETWQLDPFTGSAYPEVAVSDFTRTPGPPDLRTPAIDGTTPPSLARDQAFSWTPSGADWVLITMEVLSSGSTSIQDTVHCVAQDDGSFTVDGDAFSSWPTARQVNVRFYVATESAGILPWDNSQSQVVGMNGIFGAGLSN